MRKILQAVAIMLVTLKGDRPIRAGKMRKVLYIFITTAFFLFSCLSVSFSASTVKTVKRANRLYRDKKFDEALKNYNQAQVQLPDSEIVNFNMGAAQYKKGNYEKAIESFTKALVTEDRALEVKANYNIGNSKYRMGKLKENTDLASAVALYREALEYYKRAIELDERDKDAKYNHEFVEKKLKILLDKLKKQKEEMEKGKKGKEEKKEEKESELQEASRAAKKEEEKKEEKGEKEEGKGEEAKAQAAEEEPGEMSEEEARMLLEGYRQEEESKEKIKVRPEEGYYPEVLEDW